MNNFKNTKDNYTASNKEEQESNFDEILKSKLKKLGEKEQKK